MSMKILYDLNPVLFYALAFLMSFLLSYVMYVSSWSNIISSLDEESGYRENDFEKGRTLFLNKFSYVLIILTSIIFFVFFALKNDMLWMILSMAGATVSLIHSFYRAEIVKKGLLESE